MNTFDRADVVSFEGAQAMIASDDALRAALDRVNQLDFTMLKRKLMEEHNWTAEFIDEVESLYRKFLALNARYPDQKICPTGPIDSFWHAHILDTRAYAKDCEVVFGQLLHHFPYFGMRGPEDQAALERAFRESVELFMWNFGIDPTAGDILARSCSSQRCP
ncbi:MAG: glycine-rich domain-containing protein-like [Thermoanaerobaculia bacterium]